MFLTGRMTTGRHTLQATSKCKWYRTVVGKGGQVSQLFAAELRLMLIVPRHLAEPQRQRTSAILSEKW
jgi:hypothetical protein